MEELQLAKVALLAFNNNDVVQWMIFSGKLYNGHTTTTISIKIHAFSKFMVICQMVFEFRNFMYTNIHYTTWDICWDTLVAHVALHMLGLQSMSSGRRLCMTLTWIIFFIEKEIDLDIWKNGKWMTMQRKSV